MRNPGGSPSQPPAGAKWAVGPTAGRTLLALGVLLTAHPPDRLSAQISIHVSAGARYTSTLVHDSLGIDAIATRPRIGPAFTAGVSTPLEERWSVEALLDFSTSGLESSFDGATTDLGTLGTLAFAVVVQRSITGPLAARVGIGVLKELPSEDQGIFRSGAGTPAALATLGVAYRLPITMRYGLALDARYDAHRFSTPALAEVGFEPRWVHRVAVAVRAGGP